MDSCSRRTVHFLTQPIGEFPRLIGARRLDGGFQGGQGQEDEIATLIAHQIETQAVVEEPGQLNHFGLPAGQGHGHAGEPLLDHLKGHETIFDGLGEGRSQQHRVPAPFAHLRQQLGVRLADRGFVVAGAEVQPKQFRLASVVPRNQNPHAHPSNSSRVAPGWVVSASFPARPAADSAAEERCADDRVSSGLS
jgi:hypothetical protein